MAEKNLYVGIDITEDEAMISYSYDGMTAPITMSATMGSEDYGIPVCACYREDVAQWVYGNDALLAREEGGTYFYDKLYDRALKKDVLLFADGEIRATALLAQFVKRMALLAGTLGMSTKMVELVITVESLDSATLRILEEVTSYMAFSGVNVHYCDRQEIFYYYVIHQRPELKRHFSALYEIKGETLTFLSLEKSNTVKPIRYSIRKEKFFFSGENKTDSFIDIIGRTLGRQIYDAVYLVGDGFEGDWLRGTSEALFRGRKVIKGRDLFAGGACYAALYMVNGDKTETSFIGEHEMKFSLQIKAYERGNSTYYTIVPEGELWYEADKECEVIIDGSPVIEFWIRQPGVKEARVEALELRELPERENRTTRIAIKAHPVSDVAVKITLTDVGMGTLFPGTKQRWEHMISVKED